MTLPQKLIAVGMRYNSGAEAYLKKLSLPCSISIQAERNDKATGNMAYAVYHRGVKLAFIREADLGMLKAETNHSPAIPGYEIIQVYPNYLVLRPGITMARNPCAEIKPYQNIPEALGNYITSSDMSSIQPGNTKFKQEYSAEYLTTNKEETMFDKIVAANKTVAVSAAYLEAGRMANNQVAKLVGAKAPMMVRGYVDTPVGKLVLANLTSMAVEQFRPADAKLKKVANAMMANAYQELIRTVDIEGMLNELTSSEGIKNALAAVAGQEEVVVAKA